MTIEEKLQSTDIGILRKCAAPLFPDSYRYVGDRIKGCRRNSDDTVSYDKLVMLAKVAESRDVAIQERWWVSEKYDGIRGIWNGSQLVTRQGKVFKWVPKWFSSLLIPLRIPLDGELWMGRNTEQLTSSLASTKDVSKLRPKWNSVKYVIFDIPPSDRYASDTIPYEERRAFMERIIEIARQRWTEDRDFPLMLAHSERIRSASHLNNMVDDFIENGAEGVMVRAPGNFYEQRRSSQILKIKKEEDDEGVVVDYKMGTGRLRGKMGALILEWQSPDGTTKTVNIGTGFSDCQREDYRTLYPIGTIITFTFMNITSAGVPRHPRFKMVREDVDVAEDFKSELIRRFLEFERRSKVLGNAFRTRKYTQVLTHLANHEGPIYSMGDICSFVPKSKTSAIRIKIQNVFDGVPLEPADPKVDVLTELMTVHGIGAAAAKKFYDRGVRSVEDLSSERLTREQRLGLEYREDFLQRIPRAEVAQWETKLQELFGGGDMVGSYRRGAESSGDFDFILRKSVGLTMDRIETMLDNLITATMQKGRTKGQFITAGRRSRKLDIAIYNDSEYPFQLLHWTGSAMFNIQLRGKAISMGLKLSQKGLEREDGTMIVCHSEEEILSTLDEPWTPPEDR